MTEDGKRSANDPGGGKAGDSEEGKVSDAAAGEYTGDAGGGEEFAGDRAIIEELFGAQEIRKGALKRGFKVLPRILPYLKPYRKLAIVSVILTIITALVVLAQPWPLAFTVDSIIGDKGAPSWVTGTFGSSTGSLIAFAVFATLMLTLLSGGIEIWNEYLSTKIDQWMVLDLRSDMFDHAQKLSLAFHDTESKGILMYRINNQAAAMGQIVVQLPVVAQNVLTVIGMAYISVRINPLLALLALGTTPFVVYSTMFYTEKIEPRIYRVRGLGALNLAIVYEAMAMIRVVLAFGTQRREYKRFRKQGESWADETVGLTVRQTAFKLVVQLIASAGTAAVIGVGAYQAVNGKISAGELLVVISYINQIYKPLEDLTTTVTSFQQQFIALLMSFDLLDMKPQVTEKPDAVPLKRGRGEIELDGVGFGYERRPGVLRDVSLHIPPGRSVAIVGPTGAGKSTLASLFPRFYDATEGNVRIDGHDVRDLKLADLRSQFSIVLQEPQLFSGTIATNIAYGKPDASKEEVIAAAKAANAHDFISAFPDGYNTLLGEGGAKTSGGERQRIAVARAFLRDAPILILDEPTSSIDSRTEAVILDALDLLMQGRTAILIAHRLSTLRSVDEIVVMDDGRVIQQGTHQELIDEPGMYKQLWDAQTRSRGAEVTQLPGPAAKEKPRLEPAAAGPPAGKGEPDGAQVAGGHAGRRRRRREAKQGDDREPAAPARRRGDTAAAEDRAAGDAHENPGPRRRLAGGTVCERLPAPRLRRLLRRGPCAHAAYVRRERYGDRWRRSVHRRCRPPLRVRGSLGVPGAPRGRPLHRHDRRTARRPLSRRGADHQHARRHSAAAGACRDGPPGLHGDGSGRDRAQDSPWRARGDRVPGSARRLLHLGAELRQPRLSTPLGGVVLVHPHSPARRPRLLERRSRSTEHGALHDDRQLAPGEAAGRV